MGYGELQSEIGRLIHGSEWETWEIPDPLAKAGAWVETDVLGEEPFIRPWMVDIANDHYALDITKARELLGWKPRHSSRTTLPKMIAALKADPVAWYHANKLDFAKVAGLGAKAHEHAEKLQVERETMMQGHTAGMDAMHYETLWTQFVVIALGAWLLTSPWQFALFDPAAVATVRDVTAERGLWEPALRNALAGWESCDLVSGVLLMLFGALALSPRFAWAQWATTAFGLWLLFAPLLFWTPSAAAYVNDTAIGALAIIFSILVPMMPGMAHAGMMDKSTVPPGWTYSPSSWLQRLPIIALGTFGFLIARYLAAYQIGQIGAVWEPFFSGDAGKNGTEYIITSDVSRAWPISDAGLGATSYLIEALMGAMGSAGRWRMMPWMVTFFFILVVPLGGVSILFHHHPADHHRHVLHPLLNSRACDANHDPTHPRRGGGDGSIHAAQRARGASVLEHLLPRRLGPLRWRGRENPRLLRSTRKSSGCCDTRRHCGPCPRAVALALGLWSRVWPSALKEPWPTAIILSEHW